MELLVENPHWQCPQCNEIIEISYDNCWNCQYEKKGDEKIIKPEDMDVKSLNEEIVPKKIIPKSPVLLNILVGISIIGYLLLIFQTSAPDLPTILILTVGLISIIALVWMKKWGLLLYSFYYLFGFISCYEEPVLVIYQIIPTIVIIWGFANYRKFN